MCYMKQTLLYKLTKKFHHQSWHVSALHIDKQYINYALTQGSRKKYRKGNYNHIENDLL
jgi:tRNA(Ile)-lysidine synthase TilS/MesJ